MKKVVLACYVSLSLLCSCNDNPVRPGTDNSYFPLQIGNEWRFEYPYWTPWSGDTTARVYSKIVVSKTVNGKEYFAFDNDLPFFPSDPFVKELIGVDLDPVFVRQNEKGDIMLHVDSVEYPFLVFSETFREGDTNLVRSKIKNADYYYATESIDDTVETPIGRFDQCRVILNYFPQIKGTEHRIWFAPGYGPVKIYYPELNVTYQLVKISIQQSD